jgi:hypothetical protein
MKRERDILKGGTVEPGLHLGELPRLLRIQAAGELFRVH